MPVYRVRPDAEAYGRTLGILLPDMLIPYIPGDPGHAGSCGFPVVYGVVPSLRLSDGSPDRSQATERVVDAAQRLVAQGVRAIAAAGLCMLQYQDAVRRATGVPVCLSPLMQLPLLAAGVHASRPIGIIAADAEPYSATRLAHAGLHVANPLLFASMANRPAFAEPHYAGRLDSDTLTEETLAAARELRAQAPQLGAIVLAAPLLAPYAAAVRTATGLPVADALSAARYLHAVTQQRPYVGAY